MERVTKERMIELLDTIDKIEYPIGDVEVLFDLDKMTKKEILFVIETLAYQKNVHKQVAFDEVDKYTTLMAKHKRLEDKYRALKLGIEI